MLSFQGVNLVVTQRFIMREELRDELKNGCKEDFSLGRINHMYGTFTVYKKHLREQLSTRQRILRSYPNTRFKMPYPDTNTGIMRDSIRISSLREPPHRQHNFGCGHINI